MKELFGIQVTQSPEKYLGLPMLAGKGKEIAFREIVDKRRKRVQNWSQRWILMGERRYLSKQNYNLERDTLAGLKEAVQKQGQEMDCFNRASLAKQGWRYRLLVASWPHVQVEHTTCGERERVWRMGMWKKLWQAKLPNKLRIFAWRICHKILPVYATLQKRKILEIGTCPRCGQSDEIVLHAIVVEYKRVDGNNCITSDNRQVGKNNDYGLAIWNNRNAAVINNSLRTYQQIVSYTLNFLEEFRQAQDKHMARVDRNQCLRCTTANQRTRSDCQKWFRGRNGAVSKPIIGCKDATMVKSWAAAAAVNLAAEVGFHNIELEGDAFNVITQVMQREKNLAPIGIIIDEIQLRLSSFTSWACQYFNRDANKVSHELARMALDHVEDHYWVEETPLNVCVLVESDKLQV
ncbi:uncharacterized protein LOC111288977 [Durio zibethinus]|uniref:Uncharacterized protein LOC111288977 n=1 Tax=Durio zibethinus TaxID=66656 RepID=A0A6P5Y5A8_DURZI|nr:uncharacterized protein LOC111288977 [Durio zibethinus]